jgi:uncharacterized membrane protein YphA (DoxX/SURF4 family)/glutaredoxin
MNATVANNRNTPGFYIYRVLSLLILLVLSATFFYSGWTKIHNENAFDSFQWTFIEFGIENTILSGIIARFMIGLEFMLGLFLLFHIYLKEFTYKAILAVLVVFIVYLSLLIYKQGNTGNCGCFGDKLAMTPLQAIWKNVAMILATVFLMYKYTIKPYKFQEYVLMALSLFAFSAPFVMNNLYIGTAPVKYEKQLNLDLLYQFSPAPDVDLRKGKHIIAFMSLTCPHCKKAAFLLQVIHRKYPSLPVYMVLDGSAIHKRSFFEESKSESVPHLLFPHTAEFQQLAGDAVPSIYWVNNGKVEYKSKQAYYQLDPSYMLNWVGNN